MRTPPVHTSRSHHVFTGAYCRAIDGDGQRTRPCRMARHPRRRPLQLQAVGAARAARGNSARITRSQHCHSLLSARAARGNSTRITRSQHCHSLLSARAARGNSARITRSQTYVRPHCHTLLPHFHTAFTLCSYPHVRPNSPPLHTACSQVHISGFPGKHYCPRMAAMNKPTYRAILNHSPEKPVLVPHLDLS
jgi:hypothetical protein